jgi:hypothetical protein
VNDDINALRECWSEVEPPSPGAQDRARAALLSRAASASAPGVSALSRSAVAGCASAVSASADSLPAGSALAGSRAAAGRDFPQARTRARGWRLPAWAWRSGIAVVGAAALVATVVTTGGIGKQTDVPSIAQSAVGQPPTGQQTVAQTYELAAAYAAEQPFTPPRPDQWIYQRTRVVNTGQIAQSKGQATNVTNEFWTRYDGRQTADMDNGKLHITSETDVSSLMPPQDYPTLAALPTDPQALLNWIKSNLSSMSDKDAFAFSIIGSMLGNSSLPPDVKAALLRAAALVPGATQAAETVDVDGRPATAIGRVQDGWLLESILIDPVTHEYIGQATVAVADHTIELPAEGRQGGGEPGGPAAEPQSGSAPGPTTITIKKGEVQSMLTLLASKIVDRPGQTS